MRVQFIEDEPVEVMMAPLIDCVFLLLIFFLVATTLRKLDPLIPLELPDSAAAIDVPADEDLLVIAVDKFGQAYWGGSPVSLETLHERIAAAARDNPQQRVRIDADKDTPFQYVVHAFDLCQFEGLRNVGIHTKRFERRPGQR